MMVMSKPPPWAERVANPPYNYEHAFSVPLDAELNSSWWLCPSGEGDSRRWIRLLNNEEVPTVTSRTTPGVFDQSFDLLGYF